MRIANTALSPTGPPSFGIELIFFLPYMELIADQARKLGHTVCVNDFSKRTSLIHIKSGWLRNTDKVTGL